MPVMSIKSYLYIALLLGVIVFGFYERWHLITEGEERQALAAKGASEKAEAAAAAKIINLNMQHAVDLAKVKLTYENQLKADAVQSASDADRLREYDAYRRSHQAVASPAGGSGATPAGGGSSRADDDRFSQLEIVALGLATAGAVTNTALSACMTERDSLTGK